jgi:hypothetical protein
MIERMSLEEAGWRLRFDDAETLLPGVLVTHAFDRFSIGILISIVGTELLILWSRTTQFDIREEAQAKIVREMQEADDREIIRLLTAAVNAQAIQR